MPREIITFFFSQLWAQNFFEPFFLFHPSGRKESLSCRARSCISRRLGKPLKEQTRRRKSPPVGWTEKPICYTRVAEIMRYHTPLAKIGLRFHLGTTPIRLLLPD